MAGFERLSPLSLRSGRRCALAYLKSALNEQEEQEVPTDLLRVARLPLPSPHFLRVREGHPLSWIGLYASVIWSLTNAGDIDPVGRTTLTIVE